jgi:hypothetical protein
MPPLQDGHFRAFPNVAALGYGNEGSREVPLFLLSFSYPYMGSLEGKVRDRNMQVLNTLRANDIIWIAILLKLSCADYDLHLPKVTPVPRPLAGPASAARLLVIVIVVVSCRHYTMLKMDRLRFARI